MKTERLYLKHWEFNTYRIMQKIEDAVLERGGKIVTRYPHPQGQATLYQISDRYSDDEKVVSVWCKDWISFVLDDTYYYLQLDENPLFDHYYQKIPVSKELSYCGHYFLEVFKENNWWVDDLIHRPMTDDEIGWFAEQVLKQLLGANCSDYSADMKRIQVPNTYNDSWHYERVDMGRKHKCTFCVVDTQKRTA